MTWKEKVLSWLVKDKPSSNAPPSGWSNQNTPPPNQPQWTNNQSYQERYPRPTYPEDHRYSPAYGSQQSPPSHTNQPYPDQQPVSNTVEHQAYQASSAPRPPEPNQYYGPQSQTYNSNYRSPANNQNINSPLPAPNLDYTITTELKVKQVNLPRPIAREVKAEKYKNFILMVLGLAGFILAFVIGLLSVLEWKQVIHTADHFPSVFLMIPIAVLALILFIANFYQFSALVRQVNAYLKRHYLGNSQIPYFLINNYKRLYGQVIVTNWIAITSYVIGAIVIGLMYGLNDQTIYFLSPNAKIVVPDLTKLEIPIAWAVLAAIILFHIYIILSTRHRRNNIIAYYGYQIVNDEDLGRYKKNINRRCLIIFLIFMILLTIFLLVPYLIFRKRYKKR